MPAIHQIVAGFSKGDAISNEAVTLRRAFRSWGCESDIFCEARRILPELRREARDISEYLMACRPSDVALLHLSIGSKVNDIFAGLPCRKAILYHNVTPPHYFRIVQPRIAHDLAKGLEQVKALAGGAALNMAVSRFNAGELTELGYSDVKVVPFVMDQERLAAAPDRRVLRQLSDGLVNILFVGRCAPNKKIEDALAAFSYFQKAVEPNSRFIHVGSFAGVERYYYLLLSMARDLKLKNVQFMRSVPQPELNAYYRSAHVFLCMSEHEGFCIPLMESMWHGVPVMAFAAGAVPETLDGSGCLFREKKLPWIAEMMGEIVRNGALRSSIVQEQRKRVERYMARDPISELRGHLGALCPELAPPARRAGHAGGSLPPRAAGAGIRVPAG